MELRILAVVYRTPLLLHAAAVFAVGHFIIAEGRAGGGLNRYNSRNQQFQQK